MTPTTAVVLAAGEGTRLRSELPKVLHSIGGRPLLAHALDAVAGVNPHRTLVVASPRREEIAAAMSAAGHENVDYVVQDPPRGTGDALKVAIDHLGDPDGPVLVTNGDLPLIRAATLEALLERHRETSAAVTLLTAEAPPGSDFGRVIRGAGGDVEGIVEARDATAEQLAGREVNVGIYVFDPGELSGCLEELRPDNSQGELYLTDVVALLRSKGAVVTATTTAWEETLGVNDRAQLAAAAAALNERVTGRWMAEGISILDPASTFIDVTVTIGPDAVIRPFTFLEGDTEIGPGAEVGPQTRVIDSTVGEGAAVTFSVVRGSELGPRSSVGPYASLRPGTRLAAGAKLGTFVESKNTVLGEDSKANHLSYLGDAEIGRGVNIGAGTITCNWDGRDKHRTVIEDEAYVSSDTMLVAPVRIGRRAATGAGSVITGDVPDEALAVGVPARILPGRGNRLDRGPDDASK